MVIGPETREAMHAVVANAAANPVPLETLLKLRDGELLPDDVNEGKTLLVPMGFRVVYTHEQQEHGTLRHMSMSISLEGRVPHPDAVRMVMEEMGFVNVLEDCIFWDEPCGPDKVAINVVEPLDGDWTPFRQDVT